MHVTSPSTKPQAHDPSRSSSDPGSELSQAVCTDDDLIHSLEAKTGFLLSKHLGNPEKC